MTTTFAISSPAPTFRTVPGEHRRLTPLVDALVTFAVMAWCSVALASMVGELRGVPSAPATQAAAARDTPATLPQVSARPGNSAHAGLSLI